MKAPSLASRALVVLALFALATSSRLLAADETACPPVQLPFIDEKSFTDFVSNVKQVKDCVPFPLKAGSSRTMQESSASSVTSIQQNYIITALTDKAYLASLNLKFVGANNVALSPASTLNMRNKVSHCLREFNPLLRGPNGETLKIRTDDPTAPEIPIRIVASDENIFAQDWNPEMSCATLLHETLHLMGQVDEYIDDHRAWTQKAKCRINGSPFSIMKDLDAYTLAKDGILPSVLMPLHFYSILAGSCIAGDSTYAKCARRAYFDTVNLQACPSGERIIQQCSDLFRHSYSEYFKIRFTQVTRREEIKKLRLALASELAPYDSVHFFLEIIKDPASVSDAHWDEAVLGAQDFLANGAIDDVSADHILATFLQRMKKDPEYILDIYDIALALVKARDVNTQRTFIEQAKAISKIYWTVAERTRQ